MKPSTTAKFVRIVPCVLQSDTVDFTAVGSRPSIEHESHSHQNDREQTERSETILPNARNRNFSKLAMMLHHPVDGQVGRFTQETNHPYNEDVTYDLVLDVMETIFDNLKVLHFNVYEPLFDIYPTSSTPIIYPPGRNKFCIKEYSMTARYEGYGIPSTFWICVMPYGSYPNRKTLYVYDVQQSAWVLWRNWLLKRAEEIEAKPVDDRFLERMWWKFSEQQAEKKMRKASLRAQQSWWNQQGIPFRFMDLPGELRAKVLEYALGGVLCPVRLEPNEDAQVLGMKTTLHVGRGYNRDFTKSYYKLYIKDPQRIYVLESRNAIPRPNHGLLSISKDVRSETSHTAWTRLEKSFFEPGMFMAVVRAQTGPALTYAFNSERPLAMSYLSKIELNFTVDYYFQLFGVLPDEYPTLAISTKFGFGPTIRAIPGLKQLRICFRSPHEGATGLPGPLTGGKFSYVCCQKVVVTLVCTLMRPFIVGRGINVILDSAVKKASKDRWEASFKRGERCTLQAALSTIFSIWVTKYFQHCRCRTRCQYHGFVKEGPWDDYHDPFDYENY